MKRYIYAASAMMLAMSTIFTSCNDEAVEPVTPQAPLSDRVVYLNATTGGAEGRALIEEGEGNDFTIKGWKEGDVITAWCDYSQPFEFIYDGKIFSANLPAGVELEDIWSLTYGTFYNGYLPATFSVENGETDCLLFAYYDDISVSDNTLSANLTIEYPLLCVSNPTKSDKQIVLKKDNGYVSDVYFDDPREGLKSYTTDDISYASVITIPAGEKVYAPAISDAKCSIVSSTGREIRAPKQLENAHLYNVTLTEFIPEGSRGEAIATINGVETTQTWVQLWENGPKFATQVVAEPMTFTEAAKKGAEYVWGENWRTTGADNLEGLWLGCLTNYCQNAEGVWGYKFYGDGDYSDNSIFIPSGPDLILWSDNLLPSGNAIYWSLSQDNQGNLIIGPGDEDVTATHTVLPILDETPELAAMFEEGATVEFTFVNPDNTQESVIYGFERLNSKYKLTKVIIVGQDETDYYDGEILAYQKERYFVIEYYDDETEIFCVDEENGTYYYTFRGDVVLSSFLINGAEVVNNLTFLPAAEKPNLENAAVTPVSIKGASDGKVEHSGITTAMEYRQLFKTVENGETVRVYTDWTDVTTPGIIEGLKEGYVQVRVKATATAGCSDFVNISVAIYPFATGYYMFVQQAEIPHIIATQEEADQINDGHEIADSEGREPGDEGWEVTYEEGYPKQVGDVHGTEIGVVGIKNGGNSAEYALMQQTSEFFFMLEQVPRCAYYQITNAGKTFGDIAVGQNVDMVDVADQIFTIAEVANQSCVINDQEYPAYVIYSSGNGSSVFMT
ncbi:MAG: hypothetical protein Q4B58_04095, partial [Bacteroidales bacterium]|nr:hypothetical protein [Bacteroidales bacterium]